MEPLVISSSRESVRAIPMLTCPAGCKDSRLPPQKERERTKIHGRIRSTLWPWFLTALRIRKSKERKGLYGNCRRYKMKSEDGGHRLRRCRRAAVLVRRLTESPVTVTTVTGYRSRPQTVTGYRDRDSGCQLQVSTAIVPLKPELSQ